MANTVRRSCLKVALADGALLSKGYLYGEPREGFRGTIFLVWRDRHHSSDWRADSYAVPDPRVPRPLDGVAVSDPDAPVSGLEGRGSGLHGLW